MAPAEEARYFSLRYARRVRLFGVGSLAGGVSRGQEVRTRLFFFHAIPAWEHHLRLDSVDDARRELLSRERGGFVRSWEHRISIEPEGPHRCRYTDEVSIEAGIFTAVVWAFACLFYRYRQRRRRRLVRDLPAADLPRR